jgi:hypothetical protein
LVERWDGKAWSIVPTPNLSASIHDRPALCNVSCTSATTYWVAVGHSSATLTGTYRALIEWWDGTKWTTIPSPMPPATV